MKIVAITACPVGIAHTYMAAEKLSKTGAELGHDVKVETHGSIGIENGLTEQEIKEADGVIIAADKTVDLERFAGKRVVVVPVAEAIKQPAELIERVKTAPIQKGAVKDVKKEKDGNIVYRALMNGVSHMIPFVVVGGLLIALALAIGGEPTANGLAIPEGSIWQKVLDVGAASFMFMVPILAGYIAYAIADRPALAPGIVGGYIAANGSFYGSEAGAGFLGGILAGFAAGYLVRWIKTWKVPQMMQPIMPILVIPIISMVAIAALFIFVVGAPIAGLMEGLTTMLQGMEGSSKIVLGLLLGAMIAFDMGGPVNKVAFLFGASMIAEGQTGIMGAIAVAICIPPLGMGIATFIRKKLFVKEEQEAGKAAFMMGLVGITEGAIPFAAGDPLRVIPANMIGAMVGAAIAITVGVTNNVPHGGPVVAVLGAVDNVIMFFISVIIGSLITAFTTIFLKERAQRKVKQSESLKQVG
ncbi:MAG: PTS fructose transporter subunit IIBC [Exiguobacterium marinum]|uniref:PTS fructose transporter subunit IIBC n=1 Tax=Exiguobacterium marinum TaxID=273528 RepID=A0ABY7WX36_9BACL|nr:PTS fructose transporter subunit IIBC [Exiguobacterium marinum]WDH75446.1 PTS fructose transporter subunit IIBC [Exiguobacterium marinum]